MIERAKELKKELNSLKLACVVNLSEIKHIKEQLHDGMPREDYDFYMNRMCELEVEGTNMRISVNTLTQQAMEILNEHTRRHL